MVVFILAGLVMLGAFRFAEWYADNSAIPRYCANPQETIGYVREILSSDSPAGEGKRRPYLIAAKLIFLEPRRAAEPEQAYLDRLLDRITATCGRAS